MTKVCPLAHTRHCRRIRRDPAPQQPHGTVGSNPSPDLINAAFCPSRSAGFLPISLLRFSPLVTRDSVLSLPTQLHSSRVVALRALGNDQVGSPGPSRNRQGSGGESRREQRPPSLPAVAPWYGGSTSRVVTRGGRIDGYAFQDQACRATTPASRATSPGSGAKEDSAERDGESRSSTAGLAGRRRAPPDRQTTRRR